MFTGSTSISERVYTLIESRAAIACKLCLWVAMPRMTQHPSPDGGSQLRNLQACFLLCPTRLLATDISNSRLTLLPPPPSVGAKKSKLVCADHRCVWTRGKLLCLCGTRTIGSPKACVASELALDGSTSTYDRPSGVKYQPFCLKFVGREKHNYVYTMAAFMPQNCI